MSSKSLKVLYVGGTGTISASCVQRSVDVGMDVYVLNRGLTVGRRPLPASVTTLRTSDVRDVAATRAALADHKFDAVVNFLDFTAEHVATSIETFRGRARHYVHISTAAMYHKPVQRIPFLESTPRHNPFSQYARDKIAAEDALMRAYDSEAFPVTIVRPSHTYDDVKPPVPGDWTIIDRICRGAEIVVPGDGTSVWTLTHAADLAKGLVGLLGNPTTVGEAFHITSDYVYTWNQIYEIIAAAAGVKPRLVHIPTEFLPIAAPDWRWSELILGDLQFSAVLDNTKIKSYVPEFVPEIPFHRAVLNMLRWRGEHEAETRPDPAVDAVIDRLVGGYHEAVKLFAALAPKAPASAK